MSHFSVSQARPGASRADAAQRAPRVEVLALLHPRHPGGRRGAGLGADRQAHHPRRARSFCAPCPGVRPYNLVRLVAPSTVVDRLPLSGRPHHPGSPKCLKYPLNPSAEGRISDAASHRKTGVPDLRARPLRNVVASDRGLEPDSRRGSTPERNHFRSTRYGMLAEEVGFEPTGSLHPRRFSRPLHSTALPLLRATA